ncbi:MAG: radical SAM protein [Oscillospiraceae bacterium]|jgi:radical SAM protein with 4Fe4S-binding SPASM domain|nr:radical SAM protein [Oscillospiraceae bacterium]
MSSAEGGAPLYNEEEALRLRRENYERTQNFNRFQEAMLWQTRELHIPYKGTFELTPRCSMKCRMCYMRLDPPQIQAQGRELTTEEWIRLGQMAFDAGTVDLLLTGGEPMLRPDFAKIYTALSDMGFLLRVFSNATLVSDEILNLFRERPPQAMEITLYGASGETYQRIGGRADGYERAIRAVDELRSFLPSLKLKTTIIRDNAQDFAALSEFARQRSLPMEPTTMPLPAVRGACSTAVQERLSVDELFEFHKKHGIEDFNNDCAPPDPDARTSLFCDAGLNTYSILWNGDMVACMMDDSPGRPIGRPLEEGFEAAWDKLLAFREGKPMPEACKTCPAWATCACCAVHHFTETGAFDQRARYVCDYHRRLAGLDILP